MAIENYDFKCYRDFKVDESRSLYIRDDHQIATCKSAMTMASELGVAEFRLLERIMFIWLDFCALIPLFRGFQFNALKTRIMPALIEKIEEANRFVRENYYCAGKSVDYLSDAKIVCLGENHSKDIHRKNNGAVIDELIGKSNSDVVLVEEPQEGVFLSERVFLSEQDKYVTKSIARYGWDNRLLGSLEKLESLRSVPFGEICTKLGSGLYMVILSEYCGNPMNFLNPSYKEIIFGGLILWSVYDVINSWNTLKKIQITMEKNKIINANEFLGSNQNMCKIIEKNLGYRKIYVTAGWGHFHPYSHLVQKKVVQGVRELHEYLKDKKHMILIPRSEIS